MPGPRTRVLAVDSDPNILRLMAVNLERQGYEVATALGRRGAIDAALASPPDCVVSIVPIPELEEALRGDPRTRGVRIVVLNARRRGFFDGL